MDLVRRGLGIAVVAQGGALLVPAVAGAVEPVGIAAGACFGLLCDVLLVRALRRDAAPRVGLANAITWARCALVGGVVALVAGAPAGRGSVTLVVIAAVALVLDGVDGRVARATGTVSALGSRFDMEVDAALVLALSVAAASRVGPWVLLVGAARYLLLLATLLVPRLGAPTPPRLWRKVVAAVQGVVLTVVCAGLLGPPIDEGVALAAALALAWSFGTQIHGLLGVSPDARSIVAEPVDARVG
ncbi:CDP-alcohol phosphatidyltransferase family protein [Amnibacterium sp.]|uniref:CDP-alcohol phosphatidyltransferase family protein n=1 Tax=Amnibacterium sp. TaxID=1872496 RepID=UPI00262ABB17|nr:CDP-alcohol phosphatidyltransferase family protein [Amnibacterium sp.]